MKNHAKLATWHLENERVLVRADLNVPIYNDTIESDFRLQTLLPTIDLIHKKGGKIILITHIGRPQGPTPSLSTKILIPWFTQKGYDIEYVETLEEAYKKSFEYPQKILLLENLRFWSGEKKADPSFAQQLAQLGDYYVDDAFGSLHRNDASIALTPSFFAPEKRSIGLLVEKELAALDILIHNPQKPFILILGGGKVSDKLRYIEALLNKVNTILLCPALVFTFLKAHYQEVGKSLVDENALALCLDIEKKAQEKNVTIVLPQDYQVADKTLDGNLNIVDTAQFPKTAVGMSIGPKTIKEYSTIIHNAGTIFYNAAMGFANRPQTMQGTHELLSAMATSRAYTVVGGGDSVLATYMFNLQTSIDHLSSGGGSTLAYLTGKPLPGLKAIYN